MANKLAVIAIIGLAAAAACMGAAAAIGGGSFGDGLDSLFISGEHCERIAGATAETACRCFSQQGQAYVRRTCSITFRDAGS